MSSLQIPAQVSFYSFVFKKWRFAVFYISTQSVVM